MSKPTMEEMLERIDGEIAIHKQHAGAAGKPIIAQRFEYNVALFQAIRARVLAHDGLVEALRECATDLLIAANNSRHAAKTDHRWEGVAERLMIRVEQARAALKAAEAE